MAIYLGSSGVLVLTEAERWALLSAVDAALAKGSPEWESGAVVQIAEQGDEAPFRCHQGMPVVEDRYRPQDSDAFPVCEGWLRFRRFAGVA